MISENLIHKKFNEQWQLTFFFKGTDEERVMLSKSDNIEIMIYDKAYEIIQELFELLLSRYQTGLDKSWKGSDFILN